MSGVVWGWSGVGLGLVWGWSGIGLGLVWDWSGVVRDWSGVVRDWSGVLSFGQHCVRVSILSAFCQQFVST
jgi:hypothetical protein